MTDKLKTTLMNLPEFAAGELPTANKFNASFEQVNYALERLEKALGDLTDYDAINRALSADELLQYSLGRSVGANGIAHSFVDAKTNFVYEDTLQLGRNEWFLPVIPKGTDNVVAYSLTAATATSRLGSDVFTSDVTPNIPAAPGEYYYDAVDNKIVSFLHLIGGTATFRCTSYIDAERSNNAFYSAGLGHERFNVIPPRNVPATSITVSTSSNTNYDYIVYSNPVAPAYNTPIHDTDRSRASSVSLNFYGTAKKETFGLNPFITTTDKVSFKLPSSLSTYAEHNQIPIGHLYLFDDANNNTYLSGTYFVRDQTSVYYKGASINTASTSQYRLVNHGGLSHAELLEALRFDMKYHDHKGPRAIDHDNLRNLGGRVHTAISAHMGRGWYRPTVPSHHPHPQYLNRYGWDGGYDTANLGNLMQGHVYLAASSTNAQHQTYAQALGDTNTTSFALYLGSTDKYLMVNTYDTDFQNYVLLNANRLFLGPNNGVMISSEAAGAWSVQQVATSGTIYISTATDVKVSHVGVANLLTVDSKRVYYDIVSEGATLDVLSSSTDIKIEGILKDSDINVAGCNNVNIKVVGKILATMINETGVDYEFVTTSFSDADASPPFSGRGKYAYYDNYAIDAPRRRTKVYTPNKWLMLETDTAAGFAEYNYITSANIPKYRIRSTSTHNGIGISGTAFDVAAFLELPEDGYLQELTIGMTYQDGALRLYHYRLDGSAIEIASTTLPTMNGSSTTITWTLNTAHGVEGQRYPGVQNTAIDLLLVVENADASPAGTNMVVHAAKAVYYEMRS